MRDKDAVQTALIMADLCAYHKSQGKSLYDALLHLFSKYGYYCEGLYSLTCKGKDGKSQMAAILSKLRNHPLTNIGGKKVIVIEDYLTGERRDLINGTITLLPLPTSNVIKIRLDDDSWFCVRPSGTEAKMKLLDGSEKLEQMMQSVVKHIESS